MSNEVFDAIITITFLVFIAILAIYVLLSDDDDDDLHKQGRLGWRK